MSYNLSYRAKNLNTRRGIKPSFIVLHDTAGSGELGDVKYLANDPEGHGVSVDFVVPKSGEVYQLNPDLKKYYTNHAGRSTRFNDFRNRDVNLHSVGIEIAQKARLDSIVGELYPDVQVRAVADLCSNLCTLFNLTRNDITTHANIITDGSRSDPRKFPWDNFWRYFTNHNTGIDRSDIYTVAAGDTLWSIAVKFGITVEHLKASNNMNTPSNLIQVGQKLVV